MAENENEDKEKNKKAIEDLLKFLGMLLDPSKRNTNDDRLLEKVKNLVADEDWEGLKAIPGSHYTENIIENDKAVITIINYSIDNSAVKFTKKTIYKKSHESYIKFIELEKQLQLSIKKEDWETAADLRDQIAKFKEENQLDDSELEKVRSQMVAPPAETL